jgi:hypothetical protein
MCGFRNAGDIDDHLIHASVLDHDGTDDCR